MYGQFVFTLIITCGVLPQPRVLCEENVHQSELCKNCLHKSQWGKRINNCLNETDVYGCFKNLLRLKIKENAQVNRIKNSVNKLNTSNDTVIPSTSFITKTIQTMTNIENFLQSRNITIDAAPDLKISILQDSNDSINVSFKINNETTTTERKMKMKMKNIFPYLLLPSFIMSAVVPWILPGLKMAVMAVGMVNQMAFTSALFSLIRGYIFDTSKEEHIIYINHGYKNKHNHHGYHRHLR